ncbi:DUF1652 domain-containing protein [Pseudomonas sp. Q2-TVG4-2]|uniref:DUF1652 domain-containing protein n=1 Tax=Pseudomonas sp. Q2-TVG4-2 TaxID=1685699 RepID=UPI0015E7B6EB|nr:DUF1652 domain-containing protein [Pseudomonas sp. Q2-TVG4-2]
MLSIIELRHIIEASFLPLECKCEVGAEDNLSIAIMDKGRIRHIASIKSSHLVDARSISHLITSVKKELSLPEASTMHVTQRVEA